MPNIALHVGVRYLTRHGKIVHIKDKSGIREFIFQGDNNKLYDPDGNLTVKTEGVDDDWDIVSEYHEGQRVTQTHAVSADSDIVVLNIEDRNTALVIKVIVDGRITMMSIDPQVEDNVRFKLPSGAHAADHLN